MSEKYKFRDSDGVYFVTPTIVEWIDLFTKPQYCEIVLDSIRFCQKKKGLIVHAWCIMSSHLHLIISSTDADLSGIKRDFKKHTSKEIINQLKVGTDSRKEWILNLFREKAQTIKRNKDYKVWQDGNHPVQLYTNEMLQERLDYIHQNPVKQFIVAEPEHYIYSSAIDYAGQKGLLDIIMIE